MLGSSPHPLHPGSRATGAAVHSICEALRVMAALRPACRRAHQHDAGTRGETLLGDNLERNCLRVAPSKHDARASLLAAIPQQHDTAISRAAQN